MRITPVTAPPPAQRVRRQSCRRTPPLLRAFTGWSPTGTRRSSSGGTDPTSQRCCIGPQPSPAMAEWVRRWRREPRCRRKRGERRSPEVVVGPTLSWHGRASMARADADTARRGRPRLGVGRRERPWCGRTRPLSDASRRERPQRGRVRPRPRAARGLGGTHGVGGDTDGILRCCPCSAAGERQHEKPERSIPHLASLEHSQAGKISRTTPPP
ncbi:hypothetical protein D1007_59918 [Hordeum vulgare]|nr:hypothetical protein D1007_59918 [Hordeum vulgare]